MEHKALTAEDRCDRCGAQAYAKTLHGESSLLWCKHHLDKNPAVRADLVQDETHHLIPPSTPTRVPQP